MILLIGFFILMVAGIIIHIVRGTRDEMLGSFIAIVGGLCLLIAILAGMSNYYTTKGQIQGYYALAETIDTARTNETGDIERAALVTKIMETNYWLSQAKYWDKTWMGTFIPDEIERLKPLE